MSQNHTYAEAAAKLNLPAAWLRKHIGSLPHSKFGRLVRFNDEDIAAINAMHRQAPQVPSEGATVTILREAARQRLVKRDSRKAAA